MRCNCVLTLKERRNAHGTTMRPDPAITQTWWQTSDKGVGTPKRSKTFDQLLEAPNTKLCEGKISVKIEAEDEPYMGGSSAVLSITYKCYECGNTFFPHLPQTSDALNALLEGVVEGMDFDAAIKPVREKELADRAHRDRLIAEMDARKETTLVAKTKRR